MDFIGRKECFFRKIKLKTKFELQSQITNKIVNKIIKYENCELPELVGQLSAMIFC